MLLLEERNKLVDDWALAVGRVLVTFASCEYWTYLYVRTFGSDSLRDAVADMELAPRLEIARTLVVNRGLSEQLQNRVDRAFDTLERLSKIRNVVAHFGPMPHVHRNEQTGEIKVVHELRGPHDPAPEMTFATLQRRYAELAQLDDEFAALYRYLQQRQSMESE